MAVFQPQKSKDSLLGANARLPIIQWVHTCVIHLLQGTAMAAAVYNITHHTCWAKLPLLPLAANSTRHCHVYSRGLYTHKCRFNGKVHNQLERTMHMLCYATVNVTQPVVVVTHQPDSTTPGHAPLNIEFKYMSYLQTAFPRYGCRPMVKSSRNV